MSLDINDDAEDNYEGNFHYGVFKDNIRVRQTLKDGATRLLVMPAFDDPGDPISWIPYRNPESPLDDNGNHRFTAWIRRYYANQFVGPKGNQGHFLSPKTFDADAPDPINRLVEVASRDPRYYEILGLGPDGKKSKDDDAFKHIQLQKCEELYAINAVCLNPAKEEDAGVSCVYSLRKTMVKGKFDVKETGLLYHLNSQCRDVQGRVDPSDFAEYYFYRDVTDIAKLVPINIMKVQPAGATGKKAYGYFNAIPDGKAPPVKGTRKMLEGRYFLDDALNGGVDPADTIERLVDIFSHIPELLRKAFETQYPGVGNMLRQTGVVSSSRVHQAGRDQDDDDLPGVSSSRKAPNEELPAPKARSFAPKAPVSEPKVEEKTETSADYLPALKAPVSEPKVEEKTETSADYLPAPKKAKSSNVGTSAAVNAEAERIRRELDGLDMEKV